jgi:[glutamine synthetase] adenylyltransferase / [glutamine synthetase]-adenylyl-L-tyrosine phosphorylase
VSLHLSYLAQAIIENLLEHSFDKENSSWRDTLMVIAYGKLGSLEMNYQADLDLVFLYQPSLHQKEVDVDVLKKVLRKFLHACTIRMNSGELYDVDTRLRPSGCSGLLISDLDQFQRYQKNQAWTWEHQSLLKARCIYGTSHNIQLFEACRYEVLSKAFCPDKTRQDIVEMREKIQNHKKLKLPIKDIDVLKKNIRNIEFIAQFIMLSTPLTPDDLFRRDCLAMLSLGRKVDCISEQEYSLLSNAWTFYQGCFRANLLGRSSVKKERDFDKEVADCWHRIFYQNTAYIE